MAVSVMLRMRRMSSTVIGRDFSPARAAGASSAASTSRRRAAVGGLGMGRLGVGSTGWQALLVNHDADTAAREERGPAHRRQRYEPRAPPSSRCLTAIAIVR